MTVIALVTMLIAVRLHVAREATKLAERSRADAASVWSNVSVSCDMLPKCNITRKWLLTGVADIRFDAQMFHFVPSKTLAVCKNTSAVGDVTLVLWRCTV
jgi:hypothetical protein